MQLSRTVSGCNSGSYSFSVSLTSCITGFAIHRGPAHGVLGDVDVADAQASPRLIYFGSAGPYDPDVQWGRLSIYLNVIPRLQLEGPVQELKRQAAAALPAVARFFHAQSGVAGIWPFLAQSGVAGTPFCALLSLFVPFPQITRRIQRRCLLFGACLSYPRLLPHSPQIEGCSRPSATSGTVMGRYCLECFGAREVTIDGVQMRWCTWCTNFRAVSGMRDRFRVCATHPKQQKTR